MSDDTLRELDRELVAGNAPVPQVKRTTIAAIGAMQPTAMTFPANLTSVAGDLDRCIGAIAAVMPAVIPADPQPFAATDRELLVNSATGLKHIAEAAAGALGMLARAGIKPLEP